MACMPVALYRVSAWPSSGPPRLACFCIALPQRMVVLLCCAGRWLWHPWPWSGLRVGDVGWKTLGPAPLPAIHVAEICHTDPLQVAERKSWQKPRVSGKHLSPPMIWADFAQLPHKIKPGLVMERSSRGSRHIRRAAEAIRGPAAVWLHLEGGGRAGPEGTLVSLSRSSPRAVDRPHAEKRGELSAETCPARERVDLDGSRCDEAGEQGPGQLGLLSPQSRGRGGAAAVRGCSG